MHKQPQLTQWPLSTVFSIWRFSAVVCEVELVCVRFVLVQCRASRWRWWRRYSCCCLLHGRSRLTESLCSLTAGQSV